MGIKRVVCGPDRDGRNVFLHDGPPREVTAGDGSDPISYAWASAGRVRSTEDRAADLDPFNFRLAPGSR